MLDGIVHGFQLIPADADLQSAEMDNYLSATNLAVRDKVEATLLEEMAAGDYRVTTEKPVIVSAIRAIPKPDSDELRLIHDCSQPEGRGVNTYADIDSFSFQSLEDAIKLLGPGYYMAKVDIRHAYRAIPIHPGNYRATGLKWRFMHNHHFTYFVDTRLPFGGRWARGIFHRVSQSIRHMMVCRGYSAVVVYLDDFLTIGSTEDECQAAFLCLLQLLQDLGFDISWHKVVHPTQRLTFLGMELDTIKQCTALPHNKLVELQGVVHSFSGRTRASKRQLQQLAGKLNWACRVVSGGRTFLRRILDIISSLKSPSARYKLSSDFYADIQWWCEFLKTFNGMQLFLSSTAVEVVICACPQAAGAFFEGDWLYFNFGCETPS